jgi:hypothetical protein
VPVAGTSRASATRQIRLLHFNPTNRDILLDSGGLWVFPMHLEGENFQRATRMQLIPIVQLIQNRQLPLLRQPLSLGMFHFNEMLCSLTTNHLP